MIIVDVETGGLDPRKNPLLAIGAVDFNTKEQFMGECRPRDDLEIEDKALQINGYTKERLAGITKDTKTLLLEFLAWCSKLESDYTIAGENPSFDRDFIAENCRYYDIKNPFGHRTVDLHSIAYSVIMARGQIEIPTDDNRKNKLDADTIFVYAGIPAEPRPHIAINGARWEAEAFSRLIFGREYYEEFKEYKVVPYG
jgi:DNA polymerase III epsilon subunit-like protein